MPLMTEELSSGNQAPICRNVSVAGRRTSVRMEMVMWRSLDDILEQEGMTTNQICTMVDNLRHECGLTAALRVFIVAYYREMVRDAMMRMGSASSAPLRRDAIGRSKPMAAALHALAPNGVATSSFQGRLTSRAG